MTTSLLDPAPTASTGEALAVDLTGLRKSFGAVRAVDDLDLAIEPGGTVAVLGRNGAGKSTTINLLLGLLTPDAGRVRLFGRTPDEASAAGLIGAMLQETQPIPQLRVRELLDFLRRLYPQPMSLVDALDLANLGGLADRETAKLSGGQMQRLKFAMAVVGKPRLLVLDEPTAAMDVESRRHFWAAMHDYAGDGRTVVFTTHYIEEAGDGAGTGRGGARLDRARGDDERHPAQRRRDVPDHARSRPRGATARPSPTSGPVSTCRRARCATTSPPPSASSGYETAPRPIAPPATRAGCDRDPDVCVDKPGRHPPVQWVLPILPGRATMVRLT